MEKKSPFVFWKNAVFEKSFTLLRLILIFITSDKHICQHLSLNVPTYKAYKE